MLKKIAAIGLGAALVLSPLAALAQTDTTAPAAGAAPAEGGDQGAMAPKPMTKHHAKHKGHMAKKPMAAPAEAPAEAPKS